MSREYNINDLMGSLNDYERKNAPEIIFIEGDEALLSEGIRVSVVGSRKVSEEGAARTRSFVEGLVKHGIVVVSGLAEGVDAIAHQTAIDKGGKTVTVLGTPLSKAYPAKNKELLETIKKDHLAVSQFPEGCPVQKKNFPQRNRTMALISDATVIVEAGEKSGTRHQG